MARRNASFQELFLNSLEGAGQTAMKAGVMVADNRRAESADARAAEESKATLAYKAEATRGAKADADKAGLSYDQAFRQSNLQKAMETAASTRSTVQAGTPTADGHAVDFQAAKKANRGFEQADMNLWNSLNPGTPMDSEQLVAKRARDEDVAGMEAEEKEFGLGEKKNKAGRDATGHASDLKTAEAQRTLLGAQAGKATREANAPPKARDLPLDVQSEVRALSGKTAGKKAIANQLSSDLVEMRKAMGLDETGKPIPGATPNEDLAYSYAQNMLKTMNSKEGADAVGIDEAKRAAGLLEYNVADVKAGLGMKPGKFHGRDVPGFMKQVESNITGIRGAVNANRTEVDSLMGRGSAAQSGTPDAGLDQNDPRS